MFECFGFDFCFRDGDRFFYKGIKFDRDLFEAYPRLNDIVKDQVRLRDIIVRNTDIKPSELGKRDSVFKL